MVTPDRPDRPQWPTPARKPRSAFGTAFGAMMGIFVAFAVMAVLFVGCAAAAAS